MKIMSVDYGDARTGIAFCDKNEILATAFATINESYQPKLIEKIKDNIISKSEMIVIGLPRNMDGSYGFRCEKCKQLGEELKKKLIFPLNMRMKGSQPLSHTIFYRIITLRVKREKRMLMLFLP